MLVFEQTPSAILRQCRQIMRQMDPAADAVSSLRAGLELASLVEQAGRCPADGIPCAPGARVCGARAGQGAVPAPPVRAFASLNSRPAEAIRRAAPFGS